MPIGSRIPVRVLDLVGLLGLNKAWRGERVFGFVHGFQGVEMMRTVECVLVDTMSGFGYSYVKYVTMVQRPPSLRSTMDNRRAAISSAVRKLITFLFYQFEYDCHCSDWVHL